MSDSIDRTIGVLEEKINRVKKQRRFSEILEHMLCEQDYYKALINMLITEVFSLQERQEVSEEFTDILTNDLLDYDERLKILKQTVEGYKAEMEGKDGNV